MRRTHAFNKWNHPHRSAPHASPAWWIVNALTVGILVMPVTGLMLGHDLIVWLLLAACIDAVDGPLARALGVASRFGQRFELLIDLVAFVMLPTVVIARSGDVYTLTMIIFCVAGCARAFALLTRNDKSVSLTSDFWRPIPGRIRGLPFPVAGLLVVAGAQTPWGNIVTPTAALAMAIPLTYPRLGYLRGRDLLLMVALAAGAWWLLPASRHLSSLLIGLASGYVGTRLLTRRSRDRRGS
ncbi:CDP-alcohol phosphatidyltransferase [Mucisphaera calidilacus]|uniref:CDP-alcohol phosphatidyltransferase n=2 Tax=Mucisphaera calidilacus TaxID=2527982 RepID=A0A518BW10_9BACT|nr:CDP-alcohol phosphatidyltransferase [Mucisphaera calidilacus]